MAKGGYFGGSTILGPRSDWFGGADLGGEGRSKARRISAKKGTPTVVEEEVRIAAELERLRLGNLNRIIDAQLAHQSIPEVTRRGASYFRSWIEDFGGAENWARMQPEYEELLKKKRDKLDRKQVKSMKQPSKPE